MKTFNIDLIWGADNDHNPMRLKGTIQVVDAPMPVKPAEGEGTDLEDERKSRAEEYKARLEVIKGEYANAAFERAEKGEFYP